MSGLTNNQRKIVRFILAMTCGFAFSQLVNWQLSYIMPILLSMLMGGPAINPKTGMMFLAVIVGGCLFGLLLSMTLVNYPFVCLGILTLLLLNIYAAGNRGLSPFAVLMLLMGLTVIPLIGLPSINLSWLLVEALVTSGLIAVAFALIFFALIPTESEPAKPAAAPEGTRELSPERAALISTMVIIPLLTYFYSYSATDKIIILVFAAILAQNVNLATTARGAAVLVLANGLGGICAVIVYNLLVVAPEWPFMIALVALVSTIFAGQIFSGRPMAPLYSSAFTAVLLLVGSSVSSDSKDAAEAFITRLTQIFLAGAYVVIAFSLLKRMDQFVRGSSKPEGKTVDTGMVSDIGA